VELHECRSFEEGVGKASLSRFVGTEAGLSSSVLGTLVIVLGLLQLVLIGFALFGFNQNWHVEEERPIGSGEDYGAGAAPQPA